MFRTAIVCASRTIASTAARTARPAITRAQISPAFANRTSARILPIVAFRGYASGSGLNQEEVTGRILDLLKNFDKVGLMSLKMDLRV